MHIVFKIPFLTFSKVEVDIAEKELTWKAYIAAEALPTAKKIQIIVSKKFAKAALDLK